MLVIHQDFLNP